MSMPNKKLSHMDNIGSDQNLVYLSNQPAVNGSPAASQLRRYDVTTGRTTIIYSTTANQIQQAQVSADGQWVLFLAATPAAEQTSLTPRQR
jgi:dipeptidyl aminopeptidase/acylaminoacyl peptidase